MELWQKVIAVYPEIQPIDDFQKLGIVLQDDTDGLGAYILEWNYTKPLPTGMKVGK